LLKNLCEARNLQQITDALQSIPLVPEDEYTRLPTMRPESRLIIRHNTIEQIEHLISKAHDGGAIQEFNLWTEEDGEQEVMLIVRLLRQIIEDLLADPRFKDCQYLSFEMLELDGVRVFGAANSGVWWQINSTTAFSGHSWQLFRPSATPESPSETSTWQTPSTGRGCGSAGLSSCLRAPSGIVMEWK